jgi:hypothetical protein
MPSERVRASRRAKAHTRRKRRTHKVARWTGHQVHKTDRTLTRWGRKVERDF